MKTDVCITFDVEFTIGGAFAHPRQNRPVGEQSVICEVDGESQGLGFILKTLAAHNLSATFFVEALNYHYFGDVPMAKIAKQILAAGHDVQLHLHPCWRHFRHENWRSALEQTPPNDSMAGRSTKEIHTFIAEGITAFKRWGIPRPVALRTGGLQVDETVYPVMQKMGLPLASNVGLAIYPPEEDKLQLLSGCHSVSDVLETPVLSYCDFLHWRGKHLKSLTVTGSSWHETRTLLLQSAKHNVSPIVILSHPSEFVKHQDVQYTRLRPNRLNQRRFIKLCEFLGNNTERFNVQTFSGGLSHWRAQNDTRQKLLSVPIWMAAKRILENQINDTFY